MHRSARTQFIRCPQFLPPILEAGDSQPTVQVRRSEVECFTALSFHRSAADDALFRPDVEVPFGSGCPFNGRTDHRESFAASDPTVGCALGRQISRDRSMMRDTSYPIPSDSSCPALRHGSRQLSINCFHCAPIPCQRQVWKQIRGLMAPNNSPIFL